MPVIIKLAGDYTAPPEVPAIIVGSLAVHRAVTQFNRADPPRISDRYWSATHVASGMSLDRYAPKGPRGESMRTRREHVEWARQIQAADPEAWAKADRLAFGERLADEKLAERLLASMRRTP